MKQIEKMNKAHTNHMAAHIVIMGSASTADVMHSQNDVIVWPEMRISRHIKFMNILGFVSAFSV